MTTTNLGAALLLCLVFSSVSPQQQKLDPGAINRKLAQLCLRNPKNYINVTNVVKCNITYDVSCWKETPAGETVVQPCPFLLFDPKDNISRRCDEKGHWQKFNEMNITKYCRRLTPKEAAEKGKQAANIPATEQDDTLTHSERLQRIYVAMSWVAFFVLLPTFILICIVIRSNDRFTLHKNLILAFILRHITMFIYYYEKLGDKDSNMSVCNAFWLLNRYFAASEITWMLNEGIFLLRMLVYPFDSESYLWYYFLFGWGFSGVLTFCVYLPYMQFKIARVSAGCWAWHEYSHSRHMLVLYIPLTIMLVINFGIAVYVIQMLAKKLKDSCSSQMNRIKKSAKAVVVLISLFGLIYLLTFYLPSGNNPSYEYFIAVIYPLQGVMVCIFCIYLSSEFREALRRHWMKWRYGILIDTNPYSTDHDNEVGPSGDEGTSASVLRTESSEEIPPRAVSIASLQSKSSGKLPKDPAQRRSTQMSLLSRSSDLTKYRLKRVEPEPAVPLRVQSAGPREWVPPTLQAVKAWGETVSFENPDEGNVSEGRTNEGFSGSEFSFVGSKTSLDPNKLETSSQAELETETKDPEETDETDNRSPDNTREDTPQQSEDQFSLFSSQLFESQLFEHDAEVYKESPSSTPVPSAEPAPDDETLTAAAAGASTSQAAEPSTSAENSNASSRGKKFWDKARQMASQRRRSRLEHNRVLSTEGDSLQFHPTHTDRFKGAEEYRLAWIANILRGSKSREDESDA
ncbi:vasoactive intestinal polypeptide receptor 1-like isoform X2 [Oculina patagonica]